jgi:hypothetical protein
MQEALKPSHRPPAQLPGTFAHFLRQTRYGSLQLAALAVATPAAMTTTPNIAANIILPILFSPLPMHLNGRAKNSQCHPHSDARSGCYAGAFRDRPVLPR